jgi:2-polyprenyl-6-methoxyphenol hydroxylase-like FAD-dependent oxidoreductase
MVPVQRALVVGGSVAGMSAALSLHRLGIAVDLIERDAEWRVAGAGITITRPSLRAFQRLGILDRVVAMGHTHPGVSVYTADGRFLREVLSPPLVDADVPGAGGILRSDLHTILADAVRATAIDVRLGLTVEALDASSGTARFSDGSTGDYDLIVGADGLNSRMRTLLFPDAPGPRFTGQACWRLMTARPPAIHQRHFFLGGPVKVGLTPVSRDEMYLFLLEHVPDNPWRPPEAQPALLAQLLEGYRGVLADVRASIGPASRIVYRPLEGHLLRRDWFVGRALLIGDAAHATTPQLASGAGMAAEDALVLADEIARCTTLGQAFSGFMKRRYERCRLVVENSLRIGELEVAGAPPDSQAAVVAESLEVLAQPI